ncbi:MAG: hypothetical protein ACKVOE_05075 [Rickettsiales bacterium]
MALALKMKKQDPKPGAPAKAVKRAKKPSGSGKKEGSGRGQFILTIGEDGAILIYMRGVVSVRRLFAPSPQPVHTEAMVELMSAHPNSPLTVLVDVLDQQYVRQTFPPVSSLSVNGLVKRRLERDFQAEDITGALPLGRDKTGRKEWNFLLIALSKTPLFQAWLDLLLELPNEFKGIYLLPVEAMGFIANLRKALGVTNPQTWQLLVSHHKVSGFRQVVIRDGKLVFTRVTQSVDDAIPAVVGGNIEQEIINTLEYLRRLGLQDNALLEAYVIVSADVHDALDMKRFNLAASHVLTPLDVAEALGLEQAALSADRFGDVVVAAAIATNKKRVLRLSTGYADKLSQFYLLNRGIKVLSGLLVLGLLAMSVMNVLDAFEAKSAATESASKKVAIQSQMAEKKKVVDGLNTDVAFKTAIVTASDSYLKDAYSPLDFVNGLAPLISSEVHIADMDWNVVVKSDKAGAPATPAKAAGPLEIKLGVNFVGNYKSLQELDAVAQAFFEKIKKQLPQYDVTHEPFPWDAELKKSQEITFDIQAAKDSSKVLNEKAVFTFHGPIKTGAATSAAGVTGP